MHILGLLAIIIIIPQLLLMTECPPLYTTEKDIKLTTKIKNRGLEDSRQGLLWLCKLHCLFLPLRSRLLYGRIFSYIVHLFFLMCNFPSVLDLV